MLIALALAAAPVTEPAYNLPPAIEEPAGPADILPPAYKSRSNWQRVEKLEIVWQVLNALDFATTEYCLRRDKCHEINPLVGRNPSTEKMLAVKVAGGVVHYLVAKELAKRDVGAARTFEIISIIVQGGVVGANMRFVF